MPGATQSPPTFQWIATAYDSDEGYALGDTPEQAQANYCAAHGEPDYGFGFSVVCNRSDYQAELARVAEILGLTRKSIPLFWAKHWIVVAKITHEGVDALTGHDRAAHLMSDWTRDDGEFFITAPLPKEPRKAGLSREQRRGAAADIQPVDGIVPSQRQRDWAEKSPWNWMHEMAWAQERFEVELTPEELMYVRARYGMNVSNCTVNPVYRLRDARTQHDPKAGAQLVKRSLDAGLTQTEIAKRCGVSREYIRLLSAGDRELSYAMQVLLEDLAASAQASQGHIADR